MSRNATHRVVLNGTTAPTLEVEVTHPSGRTLVLSVHMPVTYDEDDHAVPDPDALVVWLDTPGWEPEPHLLRVNVNDGPIWNYPDQGTHAHGTMPDDPATAEQYGKAGAT